MGWRRSGLGSHLWRSRIRPLGAHPSHPVGHVPLTREPGGEGGDRLRVGMGDARGGLSDDIHVPALAVEEPVPTVAPAAHDRPVAAEMGRARPPPGDYSPPRLLIINRRVSTFLLNIKITLLSHTFQKTQNNTSNGSPSLQGFSISTFIIQQRRATHTHTHKCRVNTTTTTTTNKTTTGLLQEQIAFFFFFLFFFFPSLHLSPSPSLYPRGTFRLLIGAGMSKLGERSSSCWRQLTCTETHYYTQPMPNPFAWLFHRLPDSFHRAEAGVLG